MKIPTQTDRLAVGHIATFIWNTNAQEPRIGSYLVVEHLEADRPKSEPPHATSTWLEPFMDREVLTMGATASDEGNEWVMLLVSIDVPEEGAHFFNSIAHAPSWYQHLPGLWLEGIWYSPRRNELLKDIPNIFEKLAA